MQNKISLFRAKIEQRLRKNHNWIIKTAYVIMLFFSYVAQAGVYTLHLLFAPSHKSFAYDAEQSKNGTYTTSYYDHLQYKKRTRLFSTVSFAVLIFSVVIVNSITTFVLDFQVKPALAATCSISADTTVNQAYIDAGSCGDITVTNNAVLTFTEAIDLGGTGDFTLSVNEGVVATFSGALTLSDAGDALVINGTVTHVNAAVAGVTITAGTVTIASTGKIDVAKKGCQAAGGANGYGPNGSNACTLSTAGFGTGANTTNVGAGGGGYGGNGGKGDTYAGGVVYGSATAPALLGSSGGSVGAAGGAGGGMIVIDTDVMNHNGQLIADGGNGSNDGGGNQRAAGGGSGGAIFITADAFNGTTGTFSAKGGTGGDNAKDGGGGSGGRVAIHYVNSTYSFDASDFIMNGGIGPGNAIDGDNGTVFVKQGASPNAGVTIYHGFSFDDTDYVENSWVNDPSVIKQTCAPNTANPSITAATLTLTGGIKCDLATLTSFNVSASTAFTLLSGFSMSTNANKATVDFTIPAGNNQTWDNVNISGAAEGLFTINDAVGITLQNNTSIFANVQWTNLTNVDIQSGSIVNADFKGCQNTGTVNGYGPNGSNVCTISTAGYGAGANITNAGGGGGGYGGRGGKGDTHAGGITYGSVTAPLLFGSSGGAIGGGKGGSAGGIVRIQTTGTLTQNGSVSANGDNGTNDNGANNRAGGGGSGGSVYLTAAVFNGSTGTFSTRGGNGGDNTKDGGGGGGGRVAIEYSSGNFNFDANDFSPNGGTATGTAIPGDKGTVYVKQGSSPNANVKVFHGFDYDDTDYSETSWVIDPSTTNQYCVTGAATPSITAGTLTVAGQLKCDLPTITSFNLSASNTFSLNSGALFSVNAKASTMDFNIPNNNNQTWDNVTIIGGPEGKFTINDVIDLTLQNGTNIKANVDFSALKNLTLNTGTKIEANTKGCLALGNANGYGPNGSNVCAISTAGYGLGQNTTNSAASGAGHGGAGGNSSGGRVGGVAYGSETNPTLLGSSGGTISVALGGSGGGTVNLVLSGTLSLGGSINANGGNGLVDAPNSRTGGGGSGGSIVVKASGLAGNGGVITTTGGLGGDHTYDGGSGGGGRVRIEYAGNTSDWFSGMSAASVAAGGAAVGGGSAGSNGTLSIFQYTVPTAPTITAPLNGIYNANTNPALEASSYVSNGQSHISTDWMLKTSNNCTTIDDRVWYKNDDSGNKTSIIVNTTNGTFTGALSGQTTLANNTQYYACVRHTNTVGDSTWSSASAFTTVASGYSTFNLDYSNEADYTHNTSYVDVANGNTLAELKDLGGSSYAALGPSSLSAWSRRKAITITENSGATLTNYQVQVTVDYDADMQADFDDIRFTDSNGTVVDHYLESKTDGVSAVFWVEIPALVASTANTVYMYYGNGAASSTSSGPNTFELFKDMQTDPGGTLTGSATYDSTNKYVQLTPNSNGVNGNLYYTLNPGDDGYVAEFQFFTGGGNGADAVWFYIYASSIGAIEDDANAGYTVAYDEYNDQIQLKFNGTTLASYAHTTLDNSTWRTAKVVYAGTNIKVYLDGVKVIDFDDTGRTLSGSYVGWGARTGGLNHYHRIKNLTLRKNVSSNPTVLIGSELSPIYTESFITVSNQSSETASYIALGTFTETLGETNAGSVKYQISRDGTNWYWYKSATSTWTSASVDSAENNTATEVNAYLPQFTTDVGTGDLYFKAFLISDGTQPVQIDSIAITYQGAPIATTIPDQTLNEDANVTNKFTLADYFTDTSSSLTYSVLNDLDASLGTMTLNVDGTVDFALAANAHGSDTIQFRATNSSALSSDSNTLTITVNSVNDVPSFTKGADQTSNEDAGAQTAAGWATSLSAGPSDESGQTLSFNVANDNNALFSSQPVVASNGTLTYTAVANASGSATVTISISDNGGTANGGTDRSADQTFTITVNSVNDVPSFTKGANQTVNEDAGAQTAAGWATSLSAGPSDESGQTLSFNVANDNNALFSSQPVVASNGTLTFTPAANANGSATVTISISDNGGITNGGADRSADQTFTITVSPVNDAPIANAGSDINVNETDGSTTLDGSGSSDIESSPLTYAWIETIDSGDGCSISSTTSATPTVTIVNRESSYSCVYQLTVNDGTADSNTDTVTVSVTGANDPPTITSVTDKTIQVDSTLQFSVGANDIDTDSLDLSAADQFSTKFVDNGNNTGTLTWQPTTSDVGSHVATIQATDRTTPVTTAVNITVEDNDSNTAPTCTGSLPNVSFIAGTTTNVLFDLDDYCSDAETSELTYAANGNSEVQITITNGEVIMSADSAVNTTEAVSFTATDASNASDTTDPIVVTVTATDANEPLDPQEIDNVTGSNTGPSIITLTLNDGTERTWLAFDKGGVVPSIVVIKDTAYIFAVKRRSGSTLRIFDTTGEIVDKHRLSPKLHWRKIASGNLDGRTSSEEIVVATRRDSKLYLKVFSFKPNQHRLVYRKRVVVGGIKTGDYILRIKNKSVIVTKASGKTITWKPFSRGVNQLTIE